MADYQSVAPTTLAVTLQDCKRHLNVYSTDDDRLIETHIKAATNMLETRYNRCFVKQTRILKFDDFADRKYMHEDKYGRRRIYPARSPLASVTSIQRLTSTGGTSTIPSSDYVVSTGDKPGFIAEAYNASWPDVYSQPNSVTITYVAGHSSGSTGIPEHVKQAIRMIVAHWYRQREGVVIGSISKEIEFGIDALMEGEAVVTYA